MVLGTGSFKDEYNSQIVISFVTHSEFRPYVSEIGLYNDKNELLVVGKLVQTNQVISRHNNKFCCSF